eukprot:jgi/Astpho2/8988/Aster-x0377
MQKYEVGTVGDVEALTKYFGESYNPVDPGRVLRVVRDFMLLFDAAMLKIQTVKDRAEEEQRKKDKRAALMRPSRANSAPVMSPAKEQSQHSPSASPRRTQEEAATDMAMQAIVGVVDTQCSSPVVAGLAEGQVGCQRPAADAFSGA